MKKTAKIKITMILVIFLLSFLAYFNTFKNSFVFDDHEQVLNNPYILSYKNIPRIFSSSVWSFEEFECYKNAYYRPLMHVAYMAEYHFFWTDPAGYHAVNVFLHSLNAIILFFLVFLILKNNKCFIPEKINKGKDILAMAFFASLFFALYPINSEVVNWVAAITELTLAIGVMLALYFYIHFEERGKFYFQYLSLLFFVLALFSKETAVVLPLILLVYYLVFISKDTLLAGSWKWFYKNYPYFLVLGLYIFIRHLFLGNIFFEHKQNLILAFPVVFINAVGLFFRSLFQMIFPVNLSLFHDYEINNPEALFSAAAILLIPILYLVFKKYFQKINRPMPKIRINKFILFGFWFMAFFLLPTLNIFLYGFELSERYYYLPSAGLAMIMAFSGWYLFRILRGRKCLLGMIYGAMIALVFIVFLRVIHERNSVWKDDPTLFTDAQIKSPQNPLVPAQLAYFYCHNNELEKCQSEFEKSLELYGDSREAQNEIGGYYDYELGKAYFQNKNYPKAIEFLEKSQAASFQCVGVKYYLDLSGQK